MNKTRQEKLEDLRSVETLLWTRHREEQVFNLETYGAREYDSTEPTSYSQAATAMAQLLDMVEELLELADEDFAAADIQGAPHSTAKTYTANVLQIIDEHLADDEDA
jgi:hypothetical protein